jgi:hypothetical protein
MHSGHPCKATVGTSQWVHSSNKKLIVKLRMKLTPPWFNISWIKQLDLSTWSFIVVFFLLLLFEGEQKENSQNKKKVTARFLFL